MNAHARQAALPPSPLLSVAEAGHVLGVSPFTIKDWVRRGSIPAVRVGRLLKVRRADVDRIVAEGLTLAQTDQ